MQSSVRSFQACYICPGSMIDQNLKGDFITYLQKMVFACVILRLMTRRVCFANDTRIMTFLFARQHSLCTLLTKIFIHSLLRKLSGIKKKALKTLVRINPTLFTRHLWRWKRRKMKIYKLVSTGRVSTDSETRIKPFICFILTAAHVFLKEKFTLKVLK